MVAIRLSRAGAKKRPFYQIVVADQRRKRDGRYIERLGFFNPFATGGDVRLRIDRARAEYWIGCGARPSERVAKLLKDPAAFVEAPAPAPADETLAGAESADIPSGEFVSAASEGAEPAPVEDKAAS